VLPVLLPAHFLLFLLLMTEKKIIKVAILDLYEGAENQGMRCIRELLNQYAEQHELDLSWSEFEVRISQSLPDLSFDIYISSGGPGSPLDSKDSPWEERYFQWLTEVEHYNNEATHLNKKHVLFICHSFQLACRYFEVAEVIKRKSTAFGVFPVHMLMDAKDEPVFSGLNDPFYAVDSRDYQVVQPNHQRLRQLGATLLCIEKERPHVALERAIMGIRFNEFMIGTQFHPEADAVGMTMYLQREDKKKTVIENHGQDKWESMIAHLNDPDKILWTYSHIIPNFLSHAIEEQVLT
jgi:homoserine O-succinyltransferase/O-acetyltransferase